MFIVVMLLKAKSSKKVCPVPMGLLLVNDFWFEYLFVIGSWNNNNNNNILSVCQVQNVQRATDENHKIL